MRKILLYTLMTLAAAGMASCEDFLTRDTYDPIGSDEFWKSETDLELYANGFIQKMRPRRRNHHARRHLCRRHPRRGHPDRPAAPRRQRLARQPDRMGREQLDEPSPRELHARQHAQVQGACERRDLQPLRGRRPFLARLVSTTDKVQTFGAVPGHEFAIRGQRQRGDDETPRQPRGRRWTKRWKTLDLRRHLVAAPTPSSPKARRSSTSGWRWPSSRASASMKAPSASTTRASRRPTNRGRPSITPTTNSCARPLPPPRRSWTRGPIRSSRAM